MQPFELMKHCPRCGQPSTTPAPAIPFRCASCALELYFNPAVSVSAFILEENGCVLLIRRGKDPGKGLLATIGGFIDEGETAESALAREIREEVHLEICDATFLCSHPNSYTYKGITYPVLDLFFTCRKAAAGHGPHNDEVLSLESLNLQDVSPDDMAFASMSKALLTLQSSDSD